MAEGAHKHSRNSGVDIECHSACVKSCNGLVKRNSTHKLLYIFLNRGKTTDTQLYYSILNVQTIDMNFVGNINRSKDYRSTKYENHQQTC